MTRYWARQAWLGDETQQAADTERRDDGTRGNNRGIAEGVLVDVADGRFVAVTTGISAPPADAVALTGLLVPGLANVHSHAFHRGLRGRTQAGMGTFWTWREQMYALAERLDPDTYHALARATFAEMALAGITCVGEFHYLHHGPDGTPYNEPNEMGHRLASAAAEAGIRMTLLDTLYLTSTVDGQPLVGPQRRFGDAGVTAWADRLDGLVASEGLRIGAAAHSVRAVPVEALETLRERTRGRPLHIHLSEQRAENEACLAAHGLTPAGLLGEYGLLGPELTAVHATHLSERDTAQLGAHGVNVCFCPTTERDLADGTGPARPLADAGAALCLGTDSHAMIDMWEEARALELDERLRDERRGNFDPDDLLRAATANGHAALGWPDAGRIAPGARADLVTVRLDSVRTAGHDPSQAAAAVVFSATAADVNDVIVDGRVVVRDGHHLNVADVAQALSGAIAAAWRADPA